MATAQAEKRKVKRRRMRLDNDERRQSLLELSQRTFADRAYDDVSIDDIAQAAGISKGLLYHYFPTKRDFYVAGLREAARLLTSSVLGQESEATPIEQLRRGVDTYLTQVARHARAYRSLLRGGIGADPEVMAVIEGVRTTFLERLLMPGGSSPIPAAIASSPEVRVAMRGWIGFVESAALEWVETQAMTQRRVRDLLVDVAVSSFRIAGGETLTKDW